MAIYLNKFCTAIREHYIFNRNSQIQYWVHYSLEAVLEDKTITLNPSLQSPVFCEFVDPYRFQFVVHASLFSSGTAVLNFAQSLAHILC
jgi:hypothetical protein